VKLRKHEIALHGERVSLRPMTENDWDILWKWNNDPDVLYFAEGDEVGAYTLDQVQQIYRGVSQNAFCFIIQVDDKPIGDCWLQQMNLERILEAHPEAECRRIDLMIGEKEWWGRGLGTEVIRLLTKFAFEREKADFVFGCDIADYNLASLRAFQKAGYQVETKIEQPLGGKAHYCYDLVLSRERYVEAPEKT
jgi:RimJ/RimL family protein N-acetyltransferase